MSIGRAKKYNSVHSRGLARWTDENLLKLRAACIDQASWDDLNATFPGWGQGAILIGMRTLVARMYSPGVPQ